MSKEQIKNIKITDWKGAAQLYARVFAGEPWKEVSRCSVCGDFSSSLPGENKPCSRKGCAGAFSQEAYPVESTAAYIGKELAQPQAQGYLLAQFGLVDLAEELLGFSWGYTASAETFGQKKYQTEGMRMLINDLLVKAGFFFYVSEVGVDAPYQGAGRGRKLLTQLVDSRVATLSTVVLRTNENSPMRYLSEKIGMKPIIGLNSGIKDEENEERVVFVGR